MMKNIFLYIIVFLTNISVAQYVNYTNDTGWNLGFNIGGSWQEPERKNSNSAFSNPFAEFSRGFTLGKAVMDYGQTSQHYNGYITKKRKVDKR